MSLACPLMMKSNLILFRLTAMKRGSVHLTVHLVYLNIDHSMLASIRIAFH
jgi:hypothetical protein